MQECESSLQKNPSKSEEAILKDLHNRLDKKKGHQRAKIDALEKSFSHALIRLKLLHQVTEEFYADALIDEVDIVLDCHQEVNFPGGDTIAINSPRNLLLFNLYQHLVSVELADVVRLQSNKQEDMSPDQYSSKVVPYSRPSGRRFL